MRKTILILIVAFMASCGYTSKDNEVVGQVKKVSHETPIFCYDHTAEVRYSRMYPLGYFVMVLVQCLHKTSGSTLQTEIKKKS